MCVFGSFVLGDELADAVSLVDATMRLPTVEISDACKKCGETVRVQTALPQGTPPGKKLRVELACTACREAFETEYVVPATYAPVAQVRVRFSCAKCQMDSTHTVLLTGLYNVECVCVRGTDRIPMLEVEECKARPMKRSHFQRVQFDDLIISLADEYEINNSMCEEVNNQTGGVFLAYKSELVPTAMDGAHMIGDTRITNLTLTSHRENDLLHVYAAEFTTMDGETHTRSHPKRFSIS